VEVKRAVEVGAAGPDDVYPAGVVATTGAPVTAGPVAEPAASSPNTRAPDRFIILDDPLLS
jgi:hypothetical protein